jgi:O-Antigen ligase
VTPTSVFSRRDVRFIPAFIALVVFALWADDSGGFRTTAWYPGGLFILGLLAVAVVAGDRLAEVAPATWVALGLLAAFTAWSYLSMTWSAVPAVAWDGANRTALYLAVFALFAAVRWEPLAAGVWVGLFSLAVAAVALVDFAGVVRTPSPLGHFIYGRYNGPIEYPNGSAGLELMAAWPAVLFAAQRAVPWLLRGFLAAAAGLLVELALVSQSRGAVVATAATAIVFLLVVPTRVRGILTGILIALCVLPASHALLDVYRVVSAHGDAHAALVRAARAMSWSCGALLVATLAVAFADSRVSLSGARARTVKAAVAVILAVAAVAGVVVIAARTDPVARVRHDWHQFTATPKPYGVGLGNPTSHFAANPLSGNRYDVWRVAWHQFRRKPLTGAGADNFAVDYFRERRSQEEPVYPFSIELRTLGQTGLVGSVLLGGFLVACAAAFVQRRRGAGQAVVVSAALLVAVQWFAHGSVDFFWEIPGLAAPAFAALGLAVQTTTAPDRTVGVPRPYRQRRGLLAGAVALLAVAVGASFVFPWIAAAEVRAAEGTWRRDPAGAAKKLERARSVNPLSDEPDLVAALIDSRRRQWPQARAELHRALGRNDLNWYSWLELATVNAYTNRAGAARAELRQVKRLNPKEWTTGLVSYWLRIGKPLHPRTLDRIFLIRHEAQVAPAPPRKP